MANYIIESCGDEQQLIVNSPEIILTIGNVYFINFTGETNPGCFTIINESSDSFDDGVDTATEYNNCLECLQDNNWSFIVVSCNDPELFGPVNANQFNEWPLGQYYQLCAPPEFEFPGCLCFNVTSISNTNIDPFFDITGPFLNCDCQSPRSANTESTVCIICCDCGATGSTINQVSPPHPVWTDGNGIPVTQLNMVVLGGPNGLNA